MIKLGILTFYSSINYGAFLQAYALQTFLKAYGKGNFRVEILAYETEQAHTLYCNRVLTQKGKLRRKLRKQYRNFRKDQKRMTLSKQTLISDDLKLFEETYAQQYDILIFGSDEIWRTDGFRSFPNVYWGNYDLGKTKYVSYATSSRSALTDMKEEDRKYMEDALQKFSYIGVRDAFTRSEVEKLCRHMVHMNCDPTFLYDFEKVRKKDAHRPVLGLMLSNTRMSDKLMMVLKDKYEIRTFYTPSAKADRDNSILSPFAWVREIQQCDLFITDFFHGTVFAIKFAIPFISISLEEKAGGKIENLIHELGMCERLILSRLIRNNEFREDRVVRRILIMEKEEMPSDYVKRAAVFVREQKERAASFLEALDQLTEEISQDDESKTAGI